MFCGVKLRVSEVVKLKPEDKLLGHKSSKTTEIYRHVSSKDIGKVKSLLDNIQIRGGR